MEETSQDQEQNTDSVLKVSKGSEYKYWFMAVAIIVISAYLVSYIYDNAPYDNLDGLGDAFITVPLINLLIVASVIYGTTILSKPKHSNGLTPHDDSISTKLESKLQSLPRLKLALLVYLLVPGIIILLWWLTAGL